MDVHANAALGPAGRLAVVELVEAGLSLRRAAARLNVSPATAHRWWHRYLQATEVERETGSWLFDRSSRPHRQPRKMSKAEEAVILEARKRTRLGPGRLAGVVGKARSTIWKVLHRNGVSRLKPRQGRQTFRRYEWAEPGALLHVDMARLARFERPGHKVTGIRDKTGKEKRAGWGYVYLHCVIDDHSRYAYVEQHPGQDGEAAAKVLQRAIEHLTEIGMRAPEAVMSDNAFAYRKSTAFKAVLERFTAHHILIPPHTPRWNGKVERFIQTLKNEWAYAHSWPRSSERARALPSFIRYYNRKRPHSSLGDQPPISRVHNLRGQDI